jgi:hypothetical protein
VDIEDFDEIDLSVTARPRVLANPGDAA